MQINLILRIFLLAFVLLGLVGYVQAQPDKIPVSKEVSFNTSDGYIIKGTLYYSKLLKNDKMVSPAVILLPQLGQTRSSFDPEVKELTEFGNSVLALDLRGHGQSINMVKGGTKKFDSFNDNDWKSITNDVDAAIKFLSTQKYIMSRKYAVIGASIGANVAIISSAKHNDIKAVVALSPGLNYHSINPVNAMKTSKAKMYLIAANDDSYSADSVKKLSELNDSAKVDILNSGGHGTKLFKSNPDIIGKISGWLKTNYRPANIQHKIASPDKK